MWLCLECTLFLYRKAFGYIRKHGAYWDGLLKNYKDEKCLKSINSQEEYHLNFQVPMKKRIQNTKKKKTNLFMKPFLLTKNEKVKYNHYKTQKHVPSRHFSEML